MQIAFVFFSSAQMKRRGGRSVTLRFWQHHLWRIEWEMYPFLKMPQNMALIIPSGVLACVLMFEMCSASKWVDPFTNGAEWHVRVKSSDFYVFKACALSCFLKLVFLWLYNKCWCLCFTQHEGLFIQSRLWPQVRFGLPCNSHVININTWCNFCNFLPATVQQCWNPRVVCCIWNIARLPLFIYIWIKSWSHL